MVMKAFGEYVQTLERLYFDITRRGLGALNSDVTAALDGEAGRQLRRLVPLEDLRASGAFFTGSALAAKAAARLMPTVTRNARILDSACGAGDLLVACAKHLPAEGGFRETLEAWGRCLAGRDLEGEFVAAARYRLALAALARGPWQPGEAAADGPSLFSQIRQGCGLVDREAVGSATHIILNPPFNLMPAPPGCGWTSGGVSAAALFVDTCLQAAAKGTRIVAILPDVLRSGERYRRWRERVSSRARVEGLELCGQFDRWADVDVFLLDLMVTQAPMIQPDCWHHQLSGMVATVGDFFDVSVGPVVPFRHPHRGPWFRYLHAQGIPAWQVIDDVPQRRRFRGTVYSPPFVVVRRTSRVGDKHRAVGTIISGAAEVAVENHLIVLRPKAGGLEACWMLLDVLRSAKTNEWLDCRIRCRHLTISALAQLPIWGT
jgi:hypothetical protein